jgi:ribosomal protein S18 acetylase RimI-like enzyme
VDTERLWRVMVDALDVLPDAELVDRPDWVQLRTPSSRYANHNKILRARIDGDVDARIAAVLEDHAARGAHLTWIVDEASTPADLSQRLERAGIPIHGDMHAMTRHTHGHTVAALPNVTLAPAKPGDEALIGSVARRGWERDEAFETRLRAWAERALRGHAGDATLWTAYLDGEPVGQSLLRVLPGIGYLQGACVVPEARGRGIYAALTQARLVALAERGIDTAVVWADPRTSKPALVRLGFVERARAVWHER